MRNVSKKINLDVKFMEIQTRLDSLSNELNTIKEENYEKKKKSLEIEITRLEESLKTSNIRIKELNEMEDMYSKEVQKLEGEIKEFETSGGSVN